MGGFGTLTMNKIIWALFGNDEDGIYGTSEFFPSLPNPIRAIFWWCKNPFHNLTFHVIGFCGEYFESEGDYPKDVFSPSGWNVCIRYRPVNNRYYPFISYFGWIRFYLGWRERGNFGIKCTLNTSHIWQHLIGRA